MKNKRLISALAIVASLAFSAFCIHGFVGMVRQTHTRGVAHDVGVAVAQLEKSPPGIERAETFLRALKRIDPGFAPDEVKTALKDYINAFEQGLVEMKAGRDTTQDDERIAQARERLIQAIKKYD